MSTTREVFVVAAKRSAIGTFGGSLCDVPLTDLATLVVREALKASGAPPDSVGHVAMGNVIPTEPRDAYLGRVAALDAGIPQETPAFNVNRLCGSGLQAIISAAQAIMLGDCEVAIGAGAESMSRSPFLNSSLRWGQRMGDAQVVDYMTGVLNDPFHKIHMGITGENVATKYGVTREMMDELAAASHRRAAFAIADRRFESQIVPVEVVKRREVAFFDTDEHVKASTTVQTLSALRPAFKRDGAVTAGNSSGVNDGAAALVLASANAVRDHGLKPLARLVSYGHAGVDPLIMGIGSVPATRQALLRSGLRIQDIGVVEANEAFAAQACAVMAELGLDPEKVNPNGSGISLGHPIGATGSIISTKAIYELHRVGAKYALATMCIGGGQGIAAIYERV